MTRSEGELDLLDVAEATGDEAACVRPGAGAQPSRSSSRRAATTSRRPACGAGSPGSATARTPPPTWPGPPRPTGVPGYEERRLLCGIEQAMAGAAADPARAAAALEALEPELSPAPAPGLDGPRRARPAGARHRRPGRRGALLQRGPRGARGAAAHPPDRARRAVRRAGRPGGLGRARGVGGRPRRRRDPATATRCSSPSASGSSASPTSRPAGPSRPRSCSRPRCPCCASTSPRWSDRSAGRSATPWSRWASGPSARTAFATASAAFEARERILEAAHAQWRAGNAAWEAGDAGGGGQPLRRRRRQGPRLRRRRALRRGAAVAGQRCGPTPATSPAGWPSSTRRSRPGERLAARDRGRRGRVRRRGARAARAAPGRPPARPARARSTPPSSGSPAPRRWSATSSSSCCAPRPPSCSPTTTGSRRRSRGCAPR